MLNKKTLWTGALSLSLIAGLAVTKTYAAAFPSFTPQEIAADNAPDGLNAIFTDDEMRSQLQSIARTIDLPFNDVVRSHIFGYIYNRRESSQIILGRAKMYMPIFERALAENGLPNELKNLAVIESALNPFAVSPAGAGGLWQFMPETGRIWGLKIDRNVDERFDPYKASNAACRFLSNLYNRYGNWHCAIAAYNCGPGRVDAAIAQTGGIADFWTIYTRLPQETRNYVPAFIAANYLMAYHDVHEIQPANIEEQLLNTESIMVTRMTNFRQIGQITGLSPSVITYLNPAFRRGVVPANAEGYRITLPLAGYVAFNNFVNNPDAPMPQIINESSSENYAARPTINEDVPQWENVGTSVAVNASPRMSVRNERKDRKEHPAAPAKLNVKASKETTLIVKKGDNLSTIAQRNKIDIKELREMNKIGKKSDGDLNPGDKLVIKKAAPAPAKAKRRR